MSLCGSPPRGGRVGLVELEDQRPDQHEQPEPRMIARLIFGLPARGGVVVLDTPGRVAGRGSPSWAKRARRRVPVQAVRRRSDQEDEGGDRADDEDAGPEGVAVDAVRVRRDPQHPDHDAGRQDQRDLPGLAGRASRRSPSPPRLSSTPTKKNTDRVARITAGGSRWKSRAMAGPPMEVAVPVTPAPKPAPTQRAGRDRDVRRPDGDATATSVITARAIPICSSVNCSHQPGADDGAGHPGRAAPRPARASRCGRARRRASAPR